MTELADKHDLSQYVPVNYPQVMKCKELQGCPKRKARCPKVPCYTKDFFCAEWGPYFKCKCPPCPAYPPFTGLKEELASFDYYTRIADNPNRKYPFPQYPASLKDRTMAEKYGLENIYDCPKGELGWSNLCPENQKEFNLLYKDTVCGTCAPPDRVKTLPTEPPAQCEEEDMYDLPFRVCVGKPLEKEGTTGGYSAAQLRVRSSRGVLACLQPTSIHDLQTVNRENFKNFFEMRTPQELKLYRSPLAIDTRRPPVTIPRNPETDLVTHGPLCVNAVPMVMRPTGKPKLPRDFGPKFEVIVQGPICI